VSETERIAFLIARDGEEKARAWALDTARSYRKVVIEGKTHRLYRKEMMRSYLELKRFALRRAMSLMRLTPEQKIAKGLCPECNARDLHFGPQGGMSTNFACFSCNARFNAAFVYGSIEFFERMGSIGEQERGLFRPATIENDVRYIS
jgi:hypothetical protein